ncbi:DUF3298 domain-containing protein [Acetobacterium sp.]|jgi:hypothetical protein|uniref:DUF3298 domain-containing protein n=1 Tax=Acetobacterium sp. TaxID=1872094 RepID=UPI000CC1874D|nr:DUF3298 domain-containing protein [Acetobacterium sp.]MDO9492576.1 DUF3298 domain-containing protein [Acetobacterium sp.]PKM73669.1 MAG: hypothetical protein CVU92_06440 [Firmicutes bacterium HGW-Firmicutes-17]
MKRKMFMGMLLLLVVLGAFTAIPLGVLAETPLNSEAQTTGGADNLVPLPEAVSVANTSVSEMQTCVYQTHVQNQGWQDWRADGVMSGTEGLSYRLEGIHIKTNLENLGVTYQTHIENIGWEADTERGWKNDGQMSGTEGLSYRLEAIQIKLTGAQAANYDIWYQVHAQNIGWMGWAQNGESSGTAGFGYRLEGIRIVILPKGTAAPGSTDSAFSEKLQVPIMVTYQDGIYDPAYNYKTVNFNYQRPVFPETTPALANINATYDGLENEWQAKIPTFTTKALDYWNNDSTTQKNSHIKYNARSQMEVTCKEVYNKNYLLSLQQDVYSNYVGSTHGYHELTAHTFNTKTGTELLLGDILSIDQSQIKSKLTNEFAKLNRDDIYLDDVYEQLGPAAKYYLTDAGVCVYFNQYEVACYASGRPTITIPYSRTDLLKPIETMIP